MLDFTGVLVTYTESTSNSSFLATMSILLILLVIAVLGIAVYPPLAIISSLILILFSLSILGNPQVNMTTIYNTNSSSFTILTEEFPFHPWAEIFFTFVAIMIIFASYKKV